MTTNNENDAKINTQCKYCKVNNDKTNKCFVTHVSEICNTCAYSKAIFSSKNFTFDDLKHEDVFTVGPYIRALASNPSVEPDPWCDVLKCLVENEKIFSCYNLAKEIYSNINIQGNSEENIYYHIIKLFNKSELVILKKDVYTSIQKQLEDSQAKVGELTQILNTIVTRIEELKKEKNNDEVKDGSDDVNTVL